MASSGVRDTLAIIEELIRSAAWHRGHKALIFVSDGFGRSSLSTRSLLAAAQQEHVTVYFLDASGLKVPGRSADASVKGIGVATGFADGSPRESGPGPREGDASYGTQELATATGGFSIQNTEDLIGGLERVAQQNRSYYLLGFAPGSQRRDGKFHGIEVRVKPKGYEVRARKGYYAPDPDGRRQGEARAAPDPGPEIPLRLTVFVQGPAEEGGTRVRVLAEADPSAIRFEEKDGILGATLESSTRVTAGGQGIDEDQRHTADIQFSPELLPEKLARWLPLRREVGLAPGAYEARVRVRDPATGRQGTVRHSFEVPEPGSFRLSTPILTDRLGPDGSVQEVARRRFASGSRLLCEFEALGARRDGSTARVSVGFVLTKDGMALARSDPSPIVPTPDGRLPRRFAVSLKDLSPGGYVIELTARDELAGRDLALREPFEIEAPEEPPPAADSGAAGPVGLGATAFLDLLERYRQGDRKQVVRSLLDWPPDQHAGSLRNIENGAIACPALCLRTALLLELEFSVLQRTLHNDKERIPTWVRPAGWLASWTTRTGGSAATGCSPPGWLCSWRARAWCQSTSSASAPRSAGCWTRARAG